LDEYAQRVRTARSRGAIYPYELIDLLIDRRDHVINLCEVKFTQQPFVLTKAYKEEFAKKLFTLKDETQTRKSVFPTLITTFGLKEGTHSLGFIQSVVTMDNLFEKM